MNKTHGLNAAGASSCQLVVQNVHYDTDNNSLVSLLLSCLYILSQIRGNESFCFTSLFTQCPESTVPWSGEKIWSCDQRDPFSVQQAVIWP